MLAEIEASRPDLVPLWRKHGKGIKGTPHKSRLEAFYEFAEEHEAERLASAEIPDKEFAREAEAYARRKDGGAADQPIDIFDAIRDLDDWQQRHDGPHGRLFNHAGRPPVLDALGKLDLRSRKLLVSKDEAKKIRDVLSDILKSLGKTRGTDTEAQKRILSTVVDELKFALQHPEDQASRRRGRPSKTLRNNTADVPF